MDDGQVYTLTDAGDSLIPKGVETMGEWLVDMDDDILNAFYRVSVKKPDDRTDEENFQICSHCIVLYCRELGLTELAITSDLVSKISGNFCANVIIESLRRKGYAKTDAPLLLYKSCSVSLTDEGEEFLKKEIGKNDE